MYKLLIITACIVLVNTQNSGDLDSILGEIFDKPPKTNVSPGSGPKSCVTKDERPGECVIYYLCNENNTIVTDGADVIDIRMKTGQCEFYLDVCCELPNKKDPEDVVTPPPPPVHKDCGWRNPDGVGFKTTGDVNHETKFGEFPWMIALLKREEVNPNDPNSEALNIYVGGGSLIHPSVVLTAAHYVYKPQKLRVRAGEWDTQTRHEIYPYQERDVAKVKVHKDYNKHTQFYDVALLFLSAPMQLAPNVGLVCLPAERQLPRPGTNCFATGWGKDQFGKDGKYQVILKKRELPIVDRSTCQKALRKTRLGGLFELHSSFMCAGGEGQDTCTGDGGSPLVCPVEYEKDRYEQVGIVSWGIGCGEDGTPGVYADVSKMRAWIDDKIVAEGYEPRIYVA
ncbi:unnamed protein product [Danaus chrysippus]|uniref:Phenoloxidase-activating factor 2 n=1 Tax=Danaus chrysippus TaxID=151541 RepID=A0A8J2W124_9NEOP|nr:unnamed protein product [Danaus chrysippus]